MPAANAAASDLPLPVERELSPRALLTGALLGILLTPANVYAGLKIGWSFNMSIIALLVSYGLWHRLGRRLQQPGWTLHESNINQTVASAAASIVSGGLVAPIPAYTLLTGQALPTLPLMGWVFAVSFLGIWVAWYLRPLLLADASLKFPEGLATRKPRARSTPVAPKPWPGCGCCWAPWRCRRRSSWWTPSPGRCRERRPRRPWNA